MESLRQLRQKLKEAEQKIAQATGAIEQLTEQLREDFGCETVEDAEKMIEDLSTEIRQMQAAQEKAMADFNERWKAVEDALE